MQAALREAFKAGRLRRRRGPELMVTSIDILRAQARVPRDTVRFYEGLNAAGLQVTIDASHAAHECLQCMWPYVALIICK